MASVKAALKVLALAGSVGFGMQAAQGFTVQQVLGGAAAGLVVGFLFLLQDLKAFLEDKDASWKEDLKAWLWAIEDRTDKASNKLEVMELRLEGLVYSTGDCSRPLLMVMDGY